MSIRVPGQTNGQCENSLSLERQINWGWVTQTIYTSSLFEVNLIDIFSHNSSFNHLESKQGHYVKVSVLIKFSQKHCVYLNYCKFSIKSYVLDVY